MLILPYKKISSVSGIRLFLFLPLLLVCALIMVRVVSAQVDFARQYQAYENAINAATAALNRSYYLTATDEFIKALDVSPLEASLYYQRGIVLLIGNDATTHIEPRAHSR